VGGSARAGARQIAAQAVAITADFNRMCVS
jgi:hypothetical protein